MTDDTSMEPQRRDPRYVETSADLSDWIKVRFVRTFGPPVEAGGILMDLTPRAVRVALPDAEVDSEHVFDIGTRLLITFRFRDLAATTAMATVGRIDRLDHGMAMVLFFDVLTAAERESVQHICSAYGARKSAVPDAPAPTSAPTSADKPDSAPQSGIS